MRNSAIYITSNFVRITQVIRDRATTLKEYQLDISSSNKEDIPLALAKFLKEKDIISDTLTLIVPRCEVTIRYLNLPSFDDKEIKKMVEYELNNLFPYKLGELVFDQAIVEMNPDGYSRVMIVAAKRDDIDNQLSLLSQTGLAPDTLELSTVCLFNQFIQKKDVPDNCLLVNLEDNFLDVISINKNKLDFSRGVDLKEGDGSSKLIKEVGEVINIQKTKGIGIDKIVMTGRGHDFKKISWSLGQHLSVKVEVNETDCVSRGITVAKGANTLNINLLPEELKMQKVKLKWRKSILYLIVLVLLNASLITSLVSLKLKERREYLYFLQLEIGKIEDETLQLEKKVRRMQILKSYLNSGRLTLGLLTELYRVAPDEIVLTSLDISGQSPSGLFILAGQANNSNTVLKFASLIERSALINQADVNYIKKRRLRPSGEVVDFEIHASF